MSLNGICISCLTYAAAFMLILGHGNSKGHVVGTNLKNLIPTKDMAQPTTTAPSEGGANIEEGNQTTITDHVNTKGKSQIFLLSKWNVKDYLRWASVTFRLYNSYTSLLMLIYVS